MLVNVRLANFDDIEQLVGLDPWPKQKTWRQKISNEEVVVLEGTGRVIGLIRYSVLWATVPFMGLIEIVEQYRQLGYSRNLLEFLKEHLQGQGYVALLSSSQTDEPAAQSWHLHMGFEENGLIENIADEGIGEIVYRIEL